MNYPNFTPDGVVHMEAAADEENCDLFIMVCGLVVTIADDLVPHPCTDWITPPHSEGVNCPECLAHLAPARIRASSTRPFRVSSLIAC